MNASPLPYRTFGFAMQRQSARRSLVVLTYGVLIVVSAAAFWFCVQSSAWPARWALYAAGIVGIFVFGGQGPYGLVKAFTHRPPRRDSGAAEPLSLQLTPRPASESGANAWRNDERELSARDRAHYTAYQPLAVGMLAVSVLSAYALHPPRWLSTHALLQILLLVGIAGAVLSLTLPAALILWSEPDIDADDMPAAGGAR